MLTADYRIRGEAVDWDLERNVGNGWKADLLAALLLHFPRREIEAAIRADAIGHGLATQGERSLERSERVRGFATSGAGDCDRE